MASGKQLAEQNFRAFSTWLVAKTDNDFRKIVVRGGLSRKEIAGQCSFALSVLNQNPRIKAALLAKEEHLREIGVLLPKPNRPSPEEPALTAPRETTNSSRSLDAERLRRLELENASLKAENHELKRELGRFAVLRDILSTTGRLPR